MDVEWSKGEDGKHYEAAEHYLTLLYGKADIVLGIIDALNRAKITEHRCNDVLRAANLPRLGDHDKSVLKDIIKIKTSDPLEPVLLVRPMGGAECLAKVTAFGRDLIVADGYHRLCAIAFLDPDAVVRAKLV